jgi:hypothetical protein
MKILKSFGCSFVFGNDLDEYYLESYHVPNDGVQWHSCESTWPALIAKKLNLEYQCYARPGQGNFKIFCDILSNSYKNDQSVYLINWTWIDRFDYVDNYESWKTLRPAESSDLEKFYYRNLHSQLCDMISTASYVVSAAEHLTSLNCPYIMTYMDYNLLTPINPDWHDPRYFEVLQEKLKKILVNFDGMNFLDWSRANKFPISDAWHPLKEAHAAAAEYWLPTVKKLL